MSTEPKVLMVIAPVGYRDEELQVPRQALIDAGYAVDTVSTQAGEATGMLGAREMIAQTLSDVNIADYQGLVVVGGMGSMEYLWQNATLHQYVRAMDLTQGLVAAICLSGAVLGLAGVLNGKKATVWETPESRAAIESHGGTFTGDAVTVDGHVVTANGPEGAHEFADALLAVLKAQPVNA